MDIHHLRVFLSVLKNKSFSRASKELYLAQPTISSHIKAIEEELDCRLFDRAGRTVIPTKEAEMLYSYASEITERFAGIKTAMGRLKEEIRGELVIGASTIPGTYILPAIMARFQKKYPSISFQILIFDTKAIVEKVLKHEILLGIVGAKLVNAQVNYIPLMSDDLIVVSSPSLIRSSSMSLQDLQKYQMVLREEGSGTRRETEKILEGKGISLEHIKVAGIFSSTDSIKEAVKAGLGISILSRMSVIEELRHKILKEVKIKGIEMKRTFYLVTHKKRTLPLEYNIFLEHVKTESKRT